jgi:nucleotide-binding universal stress UspA family protein
MKKILVAIDANQVNMNVLDFACFVAKLTHSKLIGVFLDTTGGAHEIPYEGSLQESDIPVSTARGKVYAERINFFKEACKNRGANCSVHLDEGVPLTEIINESRFAELLIVDPEISFGGKNGGVPTGFIKGVLAKSECPVVIAPFSFYGIDEILFAYDGSASSVFAIRQFIYLFPELADKKVTVLQVLENDNETIVEKEKVGELLQQHYSNIGFQSLYGNASEELFGLLIKRKNVFVVMGAFGRNMLSGFFKHSTGELIIKTINLPVFIAHH